MRDPASTVVVVDVGQTETRAVVAGESADERAVTAPGFAYVRGGSVADALAATLGTVLDRLQPPGSVTAAGISTTLLPDLEEDRTRVVRLLRARLPGLGRVVVAHDAAAAAIGALEGRPGTVVTAGTGAVAFAWSPEGAARVDGWGYLLGDAGGGFSVGRSGLDAVLRASDGRGPATALTAAARRKLGEPETLTQRVHGASNPVAMVAGFAREVAHVAAIGDGVAQRILRDAAAALADSAAAASRRVFGPGEPVLVSWSGALWGAGPLLAERFVAELAERCPSATVVEPAGDGLSGARRLATGNVEVPGRLVHVSPAEL